MALIQPDEAHRLAAYLPEDYGFVAWDTETPIAVPDAVLNEAMSCGWSANRQTLKS